MYDILLECFDRSIYFLLHFLSLFRRPLIRYLRYLLFSVKGLLFKRLFYKPHQALKWTQHHFLTICPVKWLSYRRSFPWKQRNAHLFNSSMNFPFFLTPKPILFLFCLFLANNEVTSQRCIHYLWAGLKWTWNNRLKHVLCFNSADYWGILLLLEKLSCQRGNDSSQHWHALPSQPQ